MTMRFVQYVQWFCLAVASLSILAMTVLGGVDVITTAAFETPIPGAYEGTSSLMVMVVFLSLGHLEAERMQIAVDIVQRKLGVAVQKAVAILVGVLSLAFYGALTWQAWVMFTNSWSIREYSVGLVRFPIYPSKFAVVLGGALAMVCCAMRLIEVMRGSASQIQPPHSTEAAAVGSFEQL